MKALVLKDEQFVTDAKGRPVGVLLDLKTYERLRRSPPEGDSRPQSRALLHSGGLSGQARQGEMRYRVILPRSVQKELAVETN